MNRRDKRGRTPIHVAASFAKDMDFFDIFLANDKADLECCDDRNLTVLDYAKINQHGLAKEIVSRIEEKIKGNQSLHERDSQFRRHLAAPNAKVTFLANLGLMSARVANVFKLFVCAAVVAATLCFTLKYGDGNIIKSEMVRLIQYAFNNDDGTIKMIGEWLMGYFYDHGITDTEWLTPECGLLALCVAVCFVMFQWQLNFIGKGLYGGKYKQKLSYVPFAGTKPKEKHEISEPALFRFLLNEETLQQFDEAEIPEMLGILKDIDKNSKIAEVEIHQSSMGPATDAIKAFHVFIVFKTTSEIDEDYWWSLEKNLEYIILQRSRNKDDVKNRLYGKERIKVEPIKKGLKGKGAIKDLFAILLARQMIPEKNHTQNFNRQSFVTFVGQQINEIGCKCQEIFFKYSQTPENEQKQMLGLLSIIIMGAFKSLHPLSLFFTSEITNTFDTMDSNMGLFFQCGLTLLKFAIECSKTKIVRYLLQQCVASSLSLCADPTTGAVETGTDRHIQEKSIGDLNNFKAQVGDNSVEMEDKINELSLPLAIVNSDLKKARSLFKEFRADISTLTWGETGKNALHLASQYSKTTDLIDFILEMGEFHINGVDNDGWTPLHYAIVGSNAAINTRHLLKKGADPTRCENSGLTPFHLAALCVDNDFHELLESIKERKKSGETAQLFELFKNSGFYSPLRGRTNVLHDATELLDIILETGKIDINGRNVSNGGTALHFALGSRNVKTTRYLLMEKRADPTIPDHDGVTPFHLAAAFSRKLKILDFIMANNEQLDIDHRNKSGMTALHMAVKESNTVTASYLLSKGADPNAADQHGYTPLHTAVYHAKNMEIVELLLNHKDVNVNSLDNCGHGALNYAEKNEHGLGEEIAKLLKEKGAAKAKGSQHDPKNIAKLVAGGIEEDFDMQTIRFLIENKQDISAMTWGGNGANALHLAASHAKTPDVIDVILATGKFDINGVDNDGWTPLHYAMKRPNPVTMAVARRLIEMGANPGVADKNGVTPLHMAARNENAESMDLILLNADTLMDVNCVDHNGRTPLHYAIVGSNTATNARYLLKKGADPTIRANDGLTPFHIAAAYSRETDILELGLIMANNKQLDIDHRNKSGMTALHMAIKVSNVIAVRFLLSNGANPNASDQHGYTPLHAAAKYAKDMDIVKLLVNHKVVNVNSLDNCGHGALNYAEKNEHGLGEEIAKLLKEKGAAKAKGNRITALD
jgi:ankyrin repeat protein